MGRGLCNISKAPFYSFIDILNNSDIIISKGQENFEALSEERGN